MATRGRVTAALRWVLALALAVLPFGCLGGQTGQPMSDTGGGCTQPTVEIPVDRPIRRVIPIDAARALEGAYTEPLVWVDALHVPLAAVEQDEITVTFTYDGGRAFYNPCGYGGPEIDLTLDLVTRDSGIVDTGVARVVFYPPGTGPEPFGPSGEFGNFRFVGASASLGGSLRVNGGVTTVSGFLSTPSLPPFRYAKFPPDPPE
jgi:hypothetical protein